MRDGSLSRGDRLRTKYRLGRRRKNLSVLVDIISILVPLARCRLVLFVILMVRVCRRLVVPWRRRVIRVIGLLSRRVVVLTRLGTTLMRVPFLLLFRRRL